ncbi:dihydroneopterin aldolase [Paracoccus seriniphilus]|uniref:Dihydroneopterin aldolase n=2 Tax=Paracoccus seriniphilus TaxID=184748 RepID=A0A239PRG7_9RHOB|nr:dihydroneopterin aldolase [Paracoccus seriniphilus]SNT72643.1 dihydroneopterin aldolase [Paracoccus seriniphilus]
MAVMKQPDRLHLRDYVISAEIGAFQSERGRDQRLRFNLCVDLREPVSDKGDEVDRILSYDVLTLAVQTALADQRYDLVETLAERIAAEVLAHPAAAQIEVCVEKLDRGPGALGVTILRKTGQIEIATELRPWHMLLWQEQARIDQTEATIILPPHPDLPLPVTTQAQRRINLLALDQAAWALAEHLGLEVAQTRTEIDHAIDTGTAVIWAPARLAADHPEAGRTQTELAFWLAEKLGALSLDFAFAPDHPLPEAPAQFPIPLRHAALI